MGEIHFNAGDSTSWNPLWNATVNSASVPGNQYYYPIPEIEVPLLMTARIIAVYADSETAKPHWHSAGFLNQKIRTGLTVGGSQDARFGSSQRVWLKRISVIYIEKPSYQGEYAISFNVHPWHEDISLQLWEFTGIAIDSTEDLVIDQVLRRLIDIQLKVDQMSSYNQ